MSAQSILTQILQSFDAREPGAQLIAAGIQAGFFGPVAPQAGTIASNLPNGLLAGDNTTSVLNRILNNNGTREPSIQLLASALQAGTTFGTIAGAPVTGYGLLPGDNQQTIFNRFLLTRDTQEPLAQLLLAAIQANLL